ncbi:MAG: cytochrome-c peroxidase [Cypionkella sp.]
MSLRCRFPRRRQLAAAMGLMFMAAELGPLAADPLNAAPLSAAPLSAAAALGKVMFFDATLSGSGEMSCAFCHDPASHYAPSNGLVVQIGGPGLDQPGYRTVPTLTYKATTPPFTIGAENTTGETSELPPMALAATSDVSEIPTDLRTTDLLSAPRTTAKQGDTSAAPVARGGMFWDGRAVDLQDQALGPLLSPFEMANGDIPALAAKFKANYGDKLAGLFGAQVLNDPAMTVNEAAFAIARFEVEDPSFQPFSSKFDAWLAGKAVLTKDETLGQKLFDDPAKGNCAACHLDTPSADGKPPVFTDFEFEALGVPRNRAIPANADPAYFDLGLCGPLRTDATATQPIGCGLFKTPTLRNVAARKAFFHNGIYTNLADAVRFYVLRDTRPERIYPRAKGAVAAYNDLPPAYRANIDRIDAPLDRHQGEAPALTDAEIAEIVAFLNTLTDGWHL